MKEKIIQNIHDPEALEMLFRKDKRGFTLDFPDASAGIENDLVRFWRIRLKKESAGQKPQLNKPDLWIVTTLSIAIALAVKAHLVFGNMSMESFWSRNLTIIAFAGLTSWFILKNRITSLKKILLLALPVALLTIFMNLLPEKLCDTTILAFIHAPFFMWFILGLAWVSFRYTDTMQVSAFIRFNGELVTMYGLLCIAGAILSGMTISLFTVIGMDIGKFYMENIGIVGLVIFPVLAAWLIDLYPDITSRIAPIIARIFTPLVLITVTAYLIAIIVSGTNLSKNRELLVIFNLLLLGVMAIIVFSLSELDNSDIRKLNVILLFLLAVVTLIIDLFALSAIISRLSDGFTPNRTVVLISNILILLNLALILPVLFLSGFKGKPIDRVERLIYRYLPVYLLYCIVVIFVFPFIY
ncbi:MAG: hypothetical protein NTW16_16145 [Bacteroidetes bacterium]|nr:hypothetical protein [Bacteroidota bacterium]